MMKVAFFAENSLYEYSGGRYHSWVMAEALADADYEVFYITNNKPIFVDDFSLCSKHHKIKLVVTNDFTDLPNDNFDLVVFIPSLQISPFLYLKALKFCMNNNARLVFLNFETPNWFNALSPVKRNSLQWSNWKVIGNRSHLILSSTNEGNIYAQRYFSACTRYTDFSYCYPSINTTVVDSLTSENKRKKKIILTVRFTGDAKHKGGSELDEILCPAMQGYTLTLLIGRGVIAEDLMEAVLYKASQWGVKLEIKYRLNDLEKFREIQESSLVLFPSFFEGFGYPPVEAQYCNTPCIAFDLPVLREVSGDGIIYAQPGNWNEFREKITEVLNSEQDWKRLKQNIEEAASFDRYTARLDYIFRNLIDTEYCPIKKPTFVEFFMLYAVAFLLFFRRYFLDIGERLAEVVDSIWALLYKSFIYPILKLIRPIVLITLKTLFPEMEWKAIGKELCQHFGKIIRVAFIKKTA